MKQNPPHNIKWLKSTINSQMAAALVRSERIVRYDDRVEVQTSACRPACKRTPEASYMT